MAEIALTQIRHGGAEGKLTVFEEGEVVKGLSDKEMSELRLAGVLGKETKAAAADDTVEDLKAQVAALQAELDAKNATDAPTPGKAAEDLAKADAEAKAKAEAEAKSNNK